MSFNAHKYTIGTHIEHLKLAKLQNVITRAFLRRCSRFFFIPKTFKSNGEVERQSCLFY